MNDIRDMLVDTCRRICSDQGTGNGEGRERDDLWPAFVESGMAHALHPMMGGEIVPGDAAALLGPVAYHAVDVPLAETLMAQWLLSHSDLPIPETALTVSPTVVVAERSGEGWTVKGDIPRIPWLRAASHLVLPFDGGGVLSVAILPGDVLTVREGVNLADEPRDGLSIDCAIADWAPVDGITHADILAFGAGLRCVQMAAALLRVLHHTLGYVQERVQFGKPLAKLQAVQQLCAVLAGHCASAEAAAELAMEALNDGGDRRNIAAAKIRCGEAASAGSAIAHQLHGAMGITREHALHLSTRRLWSWRDEFGSEAHWARWLGSEVSKAGPEGLWPMISATAG